MIRQYDTEATREAITDSLTDESALFATRALNLIDEAHDLANDSSQEAMVIARSASAIVHAILALVVET